MTAHPGALHIHLTATRRPRSVPLARARLTRTLRRWHVPPTAVDDTALLLSELLTNAVHHGTGPTLTVHTTYHQGVVRCHVHDDGPHAPLPPPQQPRDALIESGRGLQLVQALATQWGSHLDTRHPHARHVVWFRLDTADTQAPRQPPPPAELPRRHAPALPSAHPSPAPHRPTAPTCCETDPAVLQRVLTALRAL